MKPYILIIISFLFFAKCSNRTTTNDDPLDDKLYTYFDLKETKGISKDEKSFKALDSLQKRKILPDISKGIRMEINFPYSSFFNASFVAKQKNIDSPQVIILKLLADDFNKLILITLNKANSPIDYLFIDEEEYCGGGHLFYCEKVRHSILNNKEIITYDLIKTESSQNDSISYTDSIVFKSIIKPNGKIETTQVDSVRINNR